MPTAHGFRRATGLSNTQCSSSSHATSAVTAWFICTLSTSAPTEKTKTGKDTKRSAAGRVSWVFPPISRTPGSNHVQTSGIFGWAVFYTISQKSVRTDTRFRADYLIGKTFHKKYRMFRAPSSSILSSRWWMRSALARIASTSTRVLEPG